jgi:predicted  nucleic acid-binding Zn-ribbon protein
MIGIDMTDKAHLEMRIHRVNDNLDSIESKLQDVHDKIQKLIENINEHEEMFKAIEEKLK